MFKIATLNAWQPTFSQSILSAKNVGSMQFVYLAFEIKILAIPCCPDSPLRFPCSATLPSTSLRPNHQHKIDVLDFST